MALFARERQHEPIAMLKDVIRLYMLEYQIPLSQANTAIREALAIIPEK